MYRKHHNGQLTIEEFHLPFGGTLDTDNLWVIFSSLIPWCPTTICLRGALLHCICYPFNWRLIPCHCFRLSWLFSCSLKAHICWPTTCSEWTCANHPFAAAGCAHFRRTGQVAHSREVEWPLPIEKSIVSF